MNLNLNTGKFKPFRKPNDHPIYINFKSNHPKIIIKQLPKMIAHRISTLSSDKETFENEIGPYEKALKNSGYDCKLNYMPPEPNKKRVRTRKILYFNPPFSKSVKTKVGALFLKLIDDHFPEHNIFHEIFNRSKIKISYCTMPNVKNHIAKNNAKVSSEEKNDSDDKERKCDCTRKFKGKCPLHGHC